MERFAKRLRAFQHPRSGIRTLSRRGRQLRCIRFAQGAAHFGPLQEIGIRLELVGVRARADAAHRVEEIEGQ